MNKEEICDSKKILEQAVGENDPDNTIALIRQVLETSDDSKMKLFVLGEILTKNKNDVIYGLKGEIVTLNKRIHNQRIYINKMKKSLTLTQAQVQKTNNQMNTIADKIDREAYKKACASYDTNYMPKKKVVVVKKYHK